MGHINEVARRYIELKEQIKKAEKEIDTIKDILMTAGDLTTDCYRIMTVERSKNVVVGQEELCRKIGKEMIDELELVRTVKYNQLEVKELKKNVA